MNVVACDLGGIALKLSFRRALVRWSELCGSDPQAIGLRFTFDSMFAAFEVGECSEDAYLLHLRTCLGRRMSDHELIEGWNSIFIGVDANVSAAIAALRARGVRCIGVSNTNPIHERHWKAQYPSLLVMFDAVYLSTDLRARKPDPHFYLKVANAEGCRVHDMLWVDDIHENVQGALRAGAHASLATDAQSLIRSVEVWESFRQAC